MEANEFHDVSRNIEAKKRGNNSKSIGSKSIGSNPEYEMNQINNEINEYMSFDAKKIPNAEKRKISEDEIFSQDQDNLLYNNNYWQNSNEKQMNNTFNKKYSIIQNSRSNKKNNGFQSRINNESGTEFHANIDEDAKAKNIKDSMIKNNNIQDMDRRNLLINSSKEFYPKNGSGNTNGNLSNRKLGINKENPVPVPHSINLNHQFNKMSLNPKANPNPILNLNDNLSNLKNLNSLNFDQQEDDKKNKSRNKKNLHIGIEDKCLHNIDEINNMNSKRMGVTKTNFQKKTIQFQKEEAGPRRPDISLMNPQQNDFMNFNHGMNHSSISINTPTSTNMMIAQKSSSSGLSISPNCSNYGNRNPQEIVAPSPTHIGMHPNNPNNAFTPNDPNMTPRNYMSNYSSGFDIKNRFNPYTPQGANIVNYNRFNNHNHNPHGVGLNHYPRQPMNHSYCHTRSSDTNSGGGSHRSYNNNSVINQNINTASNRNDLLIMNSQHSMESLDTNFINNGAPFHGNLTPISNRNNIDYTSFNNTPKPSRSKLNSIPENEENDFDRYHINLDKILALDDRRTTLMIKNVPVKYTDIMVLEEFKMFEDKFDIFFLPWDDKECGNKGYCFINFVHPMHILLFFNIFEGYQWKSCESKKIILLKYARYQGKEEIKKHGDRYEKKKPQYFDRNRNEPLEIPRNQINRFQMIFPEWKVHSHKDNKEKDKETFIVKFPIPSIYIHKVQAKTPKQIHPINNFTLMNN